MIKYVLDRSFVLIGLIDLTPWAMFMISLATAAAAGGSFLYEYQRAKNKKLTAGLYTPLKTVAILIASKDGEKTISNTVRAAKKNRCDVYVVSDGSQDTTVKEARAAGAKVLALRKNVGKPSALHRAYNHFKLGQRYSAVAILDDDVIIEKDFVRQSKKVMGRDVAIAVGKNLTDWPDSKRWNIWLATRTYSYWSYQLILRRLQSSFNVMNCISGSNSVYRTEVLDQVLHAKTPYIVDDTYWTLETHRLGLGEIVYAPKARAWIQDPTTFNDWYKQNLRWMWGTFQGIFGHRIGTKANLFHLAYLMLIAEWLLYILSAPFALWIIWQAGLRYLPIEIILFGLGYGVWVAAAALALKRPRLVLFVPAIVVIDFIYRILMVRAFIKSLRQPTVEKCAWVSPKRLDNRTVIAT